MLFPSVEYLVSLDGADTYYHGFPIPWNSNSLVTSLAKEVYIIPLIIDLIFYFALAYVLHKTLSFRLHKAPKIVKRLVTITAWVYGCFALPFMVSVVSLFEASTLHIWPDTDVFTLIKISIGFSV